MAEDGTTVFDVSEGCSLTPVPYNHAIDPANTYPIVDATVDWDSCSATGGVPKGIIGLHMEEYIIRFDASDNEESQNWYGVVADATIVEV